MPHACVSQSVLTGTMTIPASKSQTLRSILFASLASGVSRIKNPLDSPDTYAMIQACIQIGAQINAFDNELEIIGVNGQPKTPDDIIDAGNSGQVLRFIGAIAGLNHGYTVITGDHSIRYNRPVAPLLSGLQQLGCVAISTKQDGKAPIVIKGPMRGGRIEIEGQDSQPVSGLIIASAFAPLPITIHVLHSGEHEWVALTLSWLSRLGIPYQAHGFHDYQLLGKARYSGFSYQVPADFSSAAFPIIAACVTHSRIVIHHLDRDDPQGDKQLIDILIANGLNITWNGGHMIIDARDFNIPGMHINMNPIIDALPILAVLACFAQSESILFGAEIARHKESDRLKAITMELRKMGAIIEELPDGLKISPSMLKGSEVTSHSDHRIAMALAVAGLGALGQTKIIDIQCIHKSFPGFVKAFQDLGANIVEQAS